jgi:glycine dehydrogenase subunit 2
MHINLHKTFSTPHGGGGPGSGPVVLSSRLAPYAPLPMVVKHGDSFLLLEEQDGDAAQAFGRIKAFAGQFGTFVRALSYMLSFGSDGLWQVATDAVLNANYVRVRLQDVYTLPFAGLCKHEVLFDDRMLKGTGISTLDLAKAIIDEGFHPMTMYFPLVVAGAMLIEPTETESKQTLDSFIDVMLKLAKRAQQGDVAYFKNAPYHTPRRRLDETAAARKPVLVYKDECL